MTYDTAVWKPSPDDLLDPDTAFDRRADAWDARYPDFRPPVPELTRLADLLEERFAHEPQPWEDLRDSIDGDFLYLTMSYSRGPHVEEFIVSQAAALGLVVYSPLLESYLT